MQPEMTTANGEADARALAVALYDLAWLLPRTVGAAADDPDHLPQSELEVMRLLVRRPGLSVNEIARELGMQSSNVSATLRTLVMRGLLERRRDGVDGRVTRLHATARAIAIRDRREEQWGAALGGVLDSLPARESAQLRGAVGALRALGAQLGGG
ncbi:MAG TPA: MarR family transcriptional regulator [Solirubrobacteraceae bacterium]|nr:MarR family transcriptional regulator [Solirubrobacteraceae bacterium]